MRMMSILIQGGEASPLGVSLADPSFPRTLGLVKMDAFLLNYKVRITQFIEKIAHCVYLSRRTKFSKLLLVIVN